MTNALATSDKEIEDISNVLKKDIPSYRQAYSDRTSWIMACLSELAYIRFNPLLGNRSQETLFRHITTLIKDSDKKLLTSIINSFTYDHEKEKKNLEDTLESLDMELLKTFDNNGTQAILVLSKKNKMITLAFRGTESNSFKDIKSDANGKLVSCNSGGKIHSGFKEAYEQVSLDIQNEIKKDEYSSFPLFITGHSLGGALATVAAKKLNHKPGIAACYTYGSPRVGDEDWIKNIKTPIHRIVNAADSVTMLPPGGDIILSISWLIKYIPSIGSPLNKWLLNNFNGYMHCGNMRYLTNCQNGLYDTVELLYSVSFIYRIKGILFRSMSWKKFLADHSISIYRKKLAVVAKRRNISTTSSTGPGK